MGRHVGATLLANKRKSESLLIEEESREAWLVPLPTVWPYVVGDRDHVALLTCPHSMLQSL